MSSVLKANQMTFKEAKNYCRKSDLNNPNEQERLDAEAKLIEIGFFDEDGEILSDTFSNSNFKFAGGESLNDLDEWFEDNFC